MGSGSSMPKSSQTSWSSSSISLSSKPRSLAFRAINSLDKSVSVMIGSIAEQDYGAKMRWAQ